MQPPSGNNPPRMPESDLLKPLREVRETLEQLPQRLEAKSTAATEAFWLRAETAGRTILHGPAIILGLSLIVCVVAYAFIRNRKG